MIFGINTRCDISKLLYVISQAIRRVKFETIFWNITSGIYAIYHVQIMLLIVYTTTCRRYVIFTCRYFKLRWNTTSLSQSNCRNFSCSSIRSKIHLLHFLFPETPLKTALLPVLFPELFIEVNQLFWTITRILCQFCNFWLL